ncbi:MAG TPA: N-acetyltransferase [Halococcus sp.]|nr:N-acetyltransferase [Halococcus sp.]
MTELRKATTEDLPTLLAIQSVSLESSWPELLRVAIDGPPLVLVADNPPVGYALAIESTPTYLVELAVSPDHRNRGYGSSLLRAVLARSDECRVTTRADAERVRRFYEHHGFRVTERLPGHYEGDDGLLLVYQPDSASRDSSS